MKNTIITLLTFLVALTTFAQAPNLINYQAVVRNASGDLVTETAVGLRMSILQTTVTGTAVYTETHSVTTNTNGAFTIMMGSGTTSDNFSGIDWSSGPYFIKTEVDITGGTNYSTIGTNQLISVPYALYAETAGSVDGSSGTNNASNPLNLNNNTSFAFKSSDENKIYAWSAHTGTRSSVSYTNTAYVASSITASNGNFIFKASDDNMYYVWNAEDGVWTGASYPNTAYGAGSIITSPHNGN